jgi:short-subunit dehydrogenase
MKYFTGSTALVTGATSGIGMVFAKELAPLARTLILVGRRTGRLESLRNELTKLNPKLEVHCRTVDLAEAAQLDAFLQWLQESGLKVNVLVNNAGIGDQGDFAGAEWEKLMRIIMVNVTAVTKLTHALLPMLRSAAPAAILNVSSLSGFLPVPNLAVYAASKAFITSLSESLRAELRGTGVAVTAVCPGPVMTEFGRTAERGAGEYRPPAYLLKTSARRVVRESLEAAARDKARVLPGIKVAIATRVVSIMPMFLLRPFLNAAAKKKFNRVAQEA